jgi:hypothetical protein
MQEALTAARETTDKAERVQALTVLIPHLPETKREQVWSEALTIAQQIWNVGDRAKAMANLSCRLVEIGLNNEALLIAQQIPRKERAWVQAMASLSPQLPESLLREAVAAARKIPDEEQRAPMLSALAFHLPEPEREQLFTEVLAVLYI